MKLTSLVLPTLLLAATAHGQTRVSAASLFRAAGPTIFVSVAPSEILVFDGADNDKFVLHGRNLVVSARTVELVGHPIIRAFDDTDTPAAITQRPNQAGTGSHGGDGSENNGGDGGGGAAGAKGFAGGAGRKAGRVALQIDTVTGSGQLEIRATGGMGGVGGTGGTGGVGGGGGKGGDATLTHGGWDGGTGGPGGRGGTGGDGGAGGDGGWILLKPSLCTAVGGNLLALDVTGGVGGAGGPKGGGGAGGSGGGMGRGSISQGGGRNGSGGADGPAGSDGAGGVTGQPGKVTCLTGQPCC